MKGSSVIFRKTSRGDKDRRRRGDTQSARRRSFPVEVMTMGEFLFWTWVVGGTPLALGLIQLAVQWSHDAFRARMIAGEPVAEERRASDGSRLCMHV
jgi:hypothetical protein